MIEPLEMEVIELRLHEIGQPKERELNLRKETLGVTIHRALFPGHHPKRSSLEKQPAVQKHEHDEPRRPHAPAFHYDQAFLPQAFVEFKNELILEWVGDERQDRLLLPRVVRPQKRVDPQYRVLSTRPQ